MIGRKIWDGLRGAVLALLLIGAVAPAQLFAPASAATLLPNGEQTFVDANGAPFAGGQVFFYIPNTTTFKNTWKDPDATTLNTNPITLDAAGRAIIYGNGVYRQVLKDQFGVTIWDQLTADTAGTSQSYAGTSTGSGNAQILNGGTFGGTNGQMVTFLAGFTNTGPATLNINGFGNTQVVKDLLSGPTPLSGGEITTGNSVSVVYDSVAGVFHLVSFPPLGSAIVTTGITVNGPTVLNGAIRANGVITPTPLAVTTGDWNPAGLGSASVIRVNASVANLSLTGIVAQPAGTILSLLNVGANAFSLQPANTGSLAANRFGFQRAEVVQPSESVLIWYDAVTSNWQLFGSTPAWVGPQATRQTVVSGPTDAVLGTANFIPSTTVALSITGQNINSVQPLVVTAAAGYTLSGQTDYSCIATANPTWSGLTANQTNYLYLTVNVDGTCTPGSTIIAPIYNTGLAIGTGAGQYTFDTVHYQMWLGNGSIVNQQLVVFVGEATTNATVVTSGIAYAYKRRYFLNVAAPFPGAGVAATGVANIGTTVGINQSLCGVNATANLGYNPGDVACGTISAGGGGVSVPSVPALNTRGLGWKFTGGSGGNFVVNQTSGNPGLSAMTNASWGYQVIFSPTW